MIGESGNVPTVIHLCTTVSIFRLHMLIIVSARHGPAERLAGTNMNIPVIKIFLYDWKIV